MSQVQFHTQNQFIAQSILTLGKVYVPGGRHDDWGVSRNDVLGLMVNLEVYGYTLSRDLAFALSHMSASDLNVLGGNLVTSLSNGVLGVRLYEPMYPNFPQQVLEASEAELYCNAVMHGFGLCFGLNILPKYQKMDRKVSEEILKLQPKVLDLADLDTYVGWITRMVKANVAYSASQKDTLGIFTGFVCEHITQVEFLVKLRGLDIPNKENLAYWGNFVLTLDGNEAFELIMADKFKVVTDVLRLLAAMAGRDTSLADKFEVPRLPRAKRKLILSLVDKIVGGSADKEQVLENMLTYRSEWLRVSYACHVGEYANSYPNAWDLLQRLRNDQDITTFNGRTDSLFAKKAVVDLIAHLSKRPGVYARMLSRLLMVEAGDYVDNFERIYKENAIKIIAKKRRNAIEYNARLQRKWNKAKRAIDVQLDKELSELNEKLSNNQIAQQLSKLNLGSLKVLEEEANKLISSKKVVAYKNSQISEQPEFVEVPEVPAYDDIVYKKREKSVRDFFTAEQRAAFVTGFGAVVSKVSTPVLLQIHSHFKNIGVKMEMDSRAIMPKGGLSKMFLQEGKQARFDEQDCARVVEYVEKALVERFSKLPQLGNVYVAPELKLQNVPFAQRSASKALKTVARGSRFPVDTSTGYLRMFLWWKNAEVKGDYSYGTDIDLAVSLFDKDYNKIADCSYWNLRDEGMVHSGDIRTAPEGACEFIDVDLKKINKDAAYIVINIHSYSGQNYCDLPECFAGWMAREQLAKCNSDDDYNYEVDPNSGGIFDARTVKDKVDLASKTTSIMPMFFDIRKQEMVWADTSYGAGAICSNSVNKAADIGAILKAWNEAIKPNLYDLFELHAKARGTLVDSAVDAESIFSLNEGVTPFDFDIITSEYMTDEVKDSALVENRQPVEA